MDHVQRMQRIKEHEVSVKVSSDADTTAILVYFGIRSSHNTAATLSGQGARKKTAARRTDPGSTGEDQGAAKADGDAVLCREKEAQGTAAAR